MATKAEKQHYDRVARLGCILCRQLQVKEINDSPTEIHHVRRFGGKRSLAEVVGLCAYHHRLGDSSYHALGAKGFEKYWGISPEQLVEKTKELLDE
jgi:hypothetical protein